MSKKDAALPADRQVPKVGLSIEEAAWSLGVGQAKLYRLISEGQLPVSKIGGNSIIDPADLAALRDRHKILRNQ